MAAGAGLGCSLIYDLSPDQCGTNADCESFGANYICEEGMCKGSGGSAGTSGMGACQTTADCEAQDLAWEAAPSACIERTTGDPTTTECVKLQTPDCPVVLPKIDDGYLQNIRGNDPVILGAYGFVPDTTQYGNTLRAYDLALDEFTRDALGVPGPDGKRPVVFVVCDVDYPDREALDRGVDHLVQTLKVPGLISALPSEDLEYAFEHVGRDSNVFFISPIEADDRLMRLTDNNLMWHLLPAGEYVALPYAPLLTRTITYLTDVAGTLEAGETVRVALVTATDQRFLTDLSNKIVETIRFNGMSAAENNDAGNLRSLSVPSFANEPEADLTAQIDDIVNFQPHIVIGATSRELFNTIIPVVESRWNTSAQAPPFYLISPYNYNNDTHLMAALDQVSGLSQRMVGVNFASAPPALRYILDDFELAWDTKFNEDARGVRGYENFYDAAYYLLYAISAVSGLNPDFRGGDIADGMGRLNDREEGLPFAVGTDDITEALSLLSMGQPIYLNGTLGEPNFDQFEARTDPGSVWCIREGATVEQLVDVSLYVPGEPGEPGQLMDDGEFPCIPDF